MKRILVCEDEADAKDSLVNMLRRRNYDAAGAEDGEEALKKAKEWKPDLIILDIRMPKLDGLDVTRELRKADRNVRIIFITAFHSPQIQQEARKYDISEYIVKPVMPEDILAAVRKALV